MRLTEDVRWRNQRIHSHAAFRGGRTVLARWWRGLIICHEHCRKSFSGIRIRAQNGTRLLRYLRWIRYGWVPFKRTHVWDSGIDSFSGGYHDSIIRCSPSFWNCISSKCCIFCCWTYIPAQKLRCNGTLHGTFTQSKTRMQRTSWYYFSVSPF
jgi:hypothetical protein